MKSKLSWFKALPAGLAIRLLFLYLVRKFFKLPVGFSFAQSGEDILAPYFLPGSQGVYVDVGCNEPVRISNTFNLYLQGWRGINIDANSELISKFKKIRKQDTCICAAVSDGEREVTFYKSKTSAVSTIDKKTLGEWKKNWTFDDKDEVKVTTQKLTTILDNNLKPGTTIDLLSIDVEGHDYEVLLGLDLERYRPGVIIVEVHSLKDIADSKIYNHLLANGYSMRAYAVMNAYFTDNRRKEGFSGFLNGE